MRITLRRRLPEGGYGDVLGILESWVSDVVTVVRADGSRVVVDAADVVATRRIPPPPARR
jgi:hypothetical protein